MGFFFSEKQNTVPIRERLLEEASELGCKVCPLDKEEKLHNPKMPPTGAKEPILYFLGEAPGASEDLEGRQFVGTAGIRLRREIENIPELDDLMPYTRWNNVVRCRPTQGNANRTPTKFEIDCCKHSVIADIEATKPCLVVGFGSVPLKTFIGGTSMEIWVNRFIPIKFGNHECWYYVSYHPSFLERNKKPVDTEYDIYFRICLRNIANFLLHNYRKPTIEKDFYSGIEILSEQDAIDVIESFKSSRYIALDLETDQLKPYLSTSRILTLALSDGERHVAFKFSKKVAQKLYDLFFAGAEFITHNLKFEIEWLYSIYKTQDFFRKVRWHDTMSQAYILDERTSRDKHDGMLSLDMLTFLNFGFNLKQLTDVNRKDITKTDEQDLLIYNVLDAKYTYKLFFAQKERLPSHLIRNYDELCETSITLAMTELKGLNVDLETLENFQKKYTQQLKELDEKIKTLPEVRQFEKLKKTEFNPLSTEHLAFVFQNILKAPLTKLTESNKFSMDDEVMNSLADRYALAQIIPKYRELTKLNSTYLENVKEGVVEGRLYPNFNLMFTRTGRLSSGSGYERRD